MTSDDPFPAISPGMARERFLVKDELWDTRFRPNFNRFIIATLEFARPVIKLPVPPGRTGNHALFFLTAGQIQLTVGHQTYTLSAQDLVIVPALQIFSITAIQEDTEGFMCFFSPEALLSTAQETDYDFLKLTGNPFVTLSAEQSGYVKNLLNRLHAEYTEFGATKTDLIGAYILALLTEINRAYVGINPAKVDASDRLVQRFLDLLNTYIRQKRLVTDYAELLSVSPNHLNKVVKSRTGRSPSVWIDERIVLEAKVLLFQSNLTVAQIAAEVGYDDQSSFGKLFRKYAQTSPASFRKMIDSNQFLTSLA
ncbi:hypothetical protein GCM10027341_39310 [Spirosoma knui]